VLNSYFQVVFMAHHFQFTTDEILNIAVSVVAISLAFTFLFAGGLSSLIAAGPGAFIVLFSVSAFSIGIGFILHESMHKYFAIKYGAWAQFQASPQGLLIGLLLALFLPFTFLSPGAVYIYSAGISRKQNGIISLVGPLTNIALGLLFLGLGLVLGPSARVLVLGQQLNLLFFAASTNAFLAFFNMLPMMPLDGAKVYAWSLAIWAATVAFILGLMLALRMDLETALWLLIITFALRHFFRQQQ